MDTFTTAFFECALWSSTDNEDRPLDDGRFDLDDIDPATLAALSAECKQFQKECADMIGPYNQEAGHDFWLTRNGHGAGFWDGDWGDYGEELTAAAERFGSVDLYVGDDGKIYAMGYEGGDPCPDA